MSVTPGQIHSDRLQLNLYLGTILARLSGHSFWILPPGWRVRHLRFENRSLQLLSLPEYRSHTLQAVAEVAKWAACWRELSPDLIAK